MMSAASSEPTSPGDGRWLAGGLALLGLALLGYGSYVHLRIASSLAGGRCDGCAPWHPLFVLAPLVVGAGLVLAAGAIVRRG